MSSANSRQVPTGSEKVQAIVAEVKRRTETPCWKLTLQPEGPCGLLDSKVGGLPYWDPALPYPTDSQGNKMTLLAQLNFAQLGTEAPLPAQGLLQFFIGQDDVFGIDFDQPDSQKDFRVVYHPEPDPALTLEQIQALELHPRGGGPLYSGNPGGRVYRGKDGGIHGTGGLPL